MNTNRKRKKNKTKKQIGENITASMRKLYEYILEKKGEEPVG